MVEKTSFNVHRVCREIEEEKGEIHVSWSFLLPIFFTYFSFSTVEIGLKVLQTPNVLFQLFNQ